MITIGVDAHKRVHMAVALDAAGREVAQWRGPNSPGGWQQLLIWGTHSAHAAAGASRAPGTTGAAPAGHLVAAGAEVYGQPALDRAGAAARKPDKSDRLDARAVALLVWREAGAPPVVAIDDDTATLDLLVTEREDRVAETTRLYNQAHHLLLQLDPDYATRLPKQTQAACARWRRTRSRTARRRSSSGRPPSAGWRSA